MDLGLELNLWLGVGVLVAVWANLQLWHTRRVLNRLTQSSAIPEDRPMPQIAVEPQCSAVAQ
jgi:hypothetical protein